MKNKVPTESHGRAKRRSKSRVQSKPGNSPSEAQTKIEDQVSTEADAQTDIDINTEGDVWQGGDREEGDERQESVDRAEGDNGAEGYDREEGDDRQEGDDLAEGDNRAEGYDKEEGDDRQEDDDRVELEERQEEYDRQEQDDIPAVDDRAVGDSTLEVDNKLQPNGELEKARVFKGKSVRASKRARPRPPRATGMEQDHTPRSRRAVSRYVTPKLSVNAAEYRITGPRGQDLYDEAPPPLPPLNNAPPASLQRRKSKSVLQPYIQGSRSVSALHSTVNSPRSSQGPKSSTNRSKDDSRIHYELKLDDPELFRTLAEKDPWHPRTVRIFRNGDRFFPGYDYVFKPGRDVLNMEGLCDKVSDRIGLVRGARYIFGLDGSRKYRLEELEDGQSYVAASDRKFINLAYGKVRPGWRSNNTPNWSVRTRTEDGPDQKSSADSNKSTGSNGGKPGSRDGRTITVVNQLDHTQERSVLVNLKTVQAWEDVVADLGQVLKMRGTILLQTPWGQDVKSFSQFNNDFAAVETFYLVPREGGVETPTPPDSGGVDAVTPSRGGRRSVDPGRAGDKRGGKGQKRGNLRRHTSEPNLNDAVVGLDEQVEVASGKSVVVEVRGATKVLLAPRKDVLHNPHHPSHVLELDWVYGYRGWDTRKNLWVVKSGEMLYFVATIAVLYDRTDDHQRHYTGHTEDIQCMALHPNGVLVASGQRASQGHRLTANVQVWDSRSLRTLHVLGEGDLGVGILALDFSTRNNGEYLLAVDGDKEHLLSVWSWARQGIFGRVATHQDHVWGAAFHPLDNNLIVTHGRGLLSVWSRRKDGIFTRTDLLKDHEPRNILSIAYTPQGDLLTGDSDGLVTVWSVDAEGEYFILKEFKGHEGGVSALYLLSEGTLLSGGEKDRRVVAWDCDEDFDIILETQLPETSGGVRSVTPQRPGMNDANIYVGTIKNMILEGSLQRRFNQVVFGHSRQLWGLAINPRDGSVVTAGYDKQIVCWMSNKLHWRIQAQSECVSVAVHPSGSVVAVGTIDGHLVIVRADSGKHVATVRVCGSPLSCLSYHMSGDTLAVGSQNGSLYLYKSTREGLVYTRFTKMRGELPLSAIDWADSGKYLQTVTSDYDLTYWSVRTLSSVAFDADVQDETWASQTCPLGYYVHGIWAGRRDSPIQVCVDKSPKGDLIAAGDTRGNIRLYRYPVLSPRAGYHQYKVYTSYVSSVRFSMADRLLFTTGGTDAALLRWRVPLM